MNIPFRIVIVLQKKALTLHNHKTDKPKQTMRRKHWLPLSLVGLALAGSAYGYGNEKSNNIYDPYSREPLPAGAPSWMSAIRDNPSGVSYAVMDSLYRSWLAEDVDARVKTLERKPAVNFYRRWMKAYRPFVGSDGMIHLPTQQRYSDSLATLNARRTLTRAAAIPAAQWRNIGPNTTYVNDSKGLRLKDSQVCVYRVSVARSNPSVVYCGTETGVIFKTTDKGQTWKPCNALHNFGGAIFALQVSPINPDIVLAGGGQRLWRSDDGGQTWQMLPGIEHRVNSIRFSPSDPATITVASGINDGQGGGFFVSTDGGATFRKTFDGICHDHELQPGNARRVYLLARAEGQEKFGFYVSTDGGEHFEASPLPVGNITAGRLCVSDAPNGQDYVYALVNAKDGTYDEGPYGGLGVPYILQSKDGGQSWTDNTTRSGRGQTFSDYIDNGKGGQGYFDMMVGAAADNPDHVIFGLCSAYRSTEGGKGELRNTAIGGYQNLDGMHPDMQDIDVCGSDTWICTDGGVKYSADFFATPGTDRNNGIYASDFHGFGQGWNEDVMAGGRWHNGDIVAAAAYSEGNTLHIGGVEYATGHVMLSNPEKVYFSDAGTSIIPRSLDGKITTTYGEQFAAKKPHETLLTNNELSYDPRYALRLMMSSNEQDDRDKVYISEDEGRSFRMFCDLEGEDVADYEFARSNPDYVYVAGKYNIYYFFDNGSTWDWFENRAFEDESNGSVGIDIAVDPRDENKIWFANGTLPGRVAYTTDRGRTWHYPLTEDLKSLRFNWIILTGNEKNSVYLGTQEQARVFYKDDTMSGWTEYSDGLPSGARMARLKPFYKEGLLRAATSQGIWQTPLRDAQFKPVAQPMALNIGNGDLTATPEKEVVFDSYSIVNQNGAKWQWAFNPQPRSVTGADTRSPRVVFGNKGSYDVTLTVTTPNGSDSRTIRGMIRIGVPTAIATAKAQPKVSVRTETAGERLMMTVSAEELNETKTLTLHNAKGMLLHKEVMDPDSRGKTISLPRYGKGIYIYELRTPTRKYFGKFSVE